jgi:hypothetical protein
VGWCGVVFFSFLGVFWVVECFNEKWLHHHQLESYSKDSNFLVGWCGVVFFSFLGVFWVVECFNEKWLHHHQLESYSKDLSSVMEQNYIGHEYIWPAFQCKFVQQRLAVQGCVFPCSAT